MGIRRRLVYFLILALALAAAAAFVPGPSVASGKDHERAQQARERGEILPLERILSLVGQRIPGDVVKVELEREDGIWVYEIKVIDARGRLMEVEIDARTGGILKIEED